MATGMEAGFGRMETLLVALLVALLAEEGEQDGSGVTG